MAVETGPQGPRVRVIDNGPGVPEAERDKLFDRFYRALSNRSAPGSGLGLAVVREVEALQDMDYSLITERRRHAPPGAAGGAGGATGRNLLDGEELPPKAIGELQPGQRLRIETPGGGGYGNAQESVP